MRSRRFGAIVGGVTLVLAGCSSGNGDVSRTAQTLQHQVLEVATAASAQQYAVAIQRLDQLEQADDAALTAGTITRARHDAILATIAKVRADLRALEVASQPTVTPAPKSKHQKKGGGHTSDHGNGDGGD